jgi:putative hydrolase of the HAD superfamily
MSNYKLILFDLGGVLIELTGVPRMVELTNGNLTADQLWEKWILSPAVRLYESGKIATGEFGAMIIKEFEMDILPEKYLAEFTAWPRGKYPRVNELLNAIKKTHTIATLSNTNPLHWNRMVNEMDFIDLFDYNFPSHLTSFLKPDLETYNHVARETGIGPQEILFFDDNELNVRGAKKAGMDGVMVKGTAEAQKYLRSMNII